MNHEGQSGGEPRAYVAYLLRIWREQDGASTRWRASLQDPHSGERQGFANLEALFEFLIQKVGTAGKP